MHLDVALIPHGILRRLPVAEGARHHVNVLLSVLALTLLFLAGWALRISDALPHCCLFDLALGVECPACGMTRSLALLAGGDLRASIKMQPCGVLLVMALVIQTSARIALLKGWSSVGSATQIVNWIGNLFVLMLILWWAYRMLLN